MKIRAVDVVRPRAGLHRHRIGHIIDLPDGLHRQPGAFRHIGLGLSGIAKTGPWGVDVEVKFWLLNDSDAGCNAIPILLDILDLNLIIGQTS
jgi:hypothetical protein